MIHESDNFNDLYRKTLLSLRNIGQRSSPRGLETMEQVGVQLRLTNPYHNILYSPARNLNYRFQIAEWLWILLGQNDTGIGTFNKNLLQFSDDERTFSGAYGPKISDQLTYVVDVLTNDTSSRQAVINIWRERPRASKDIPCTLSLQFLIRDKKLTLITTMRSNDVYLGLPYDLFTFTQIQNYVARLLNVKMGEYVHNVGSLHVYQPHYDKLSAIIQESYQPNLKSPRILDTAGLSDVRVLFNVLASYGPYARGSFFTDLVQDLVIRPPWGMYLRVLGSKWNQRLLDGIDEPYNRIYHAAVQK